LAESAGDDVSQYCTANGDGAYDDDGQDDVFQSGHAALVALEGSKQFTHGVLLVGEEFEGLVVTGTTEIPPVAISHRKSRRVSNCMLDAVYFPNRYREIE